MQNTSIRRLGALATVLGSLALVNTAAACPNRRQAQASPQPAAPLAAQQQQTLDCPYARGQASGLSFGSKLLAATVPVGFVAFGLGWLSMGRRRRARSNDASS